jgi:hypothetical protein
MSAAGRGDEGFPRSVPVVGGAAFSGAVVSGVVDSSLAASWGSALGSKSFVYEKIKSTAMCARRSKQGGASGGDKKMHGYRRAGIR